MVSTLPSDSDGGVVAHSKASLAAIYDEVDWGALFSQQMEKASGSPAAPAEGSERRRLTASKSAESTLHTPHNGERSRPSIVVSEQSRLSMCRRSRSVSWVAGEKEEVRFFRKEDVVPPPGVGPPPSKSEKWKPRPDDIASSDSDSSDSSDESDVESSHLDGEVRSSLASVLTQQSVFDLCSPKIKLPTQKSSLRQGSAFGLQPSTQDSAPPAVAPAGETRSLTRNSTGPTPPTRGSSDGAEQRSLGPQDSPTVSDTSSSTVDGHPLWPGAAATETRSPLRSDARDSAPTGSQWKRSSGADEGRGSGPSDKSTDRSGEMRQEIADTSAILPLAVVFDKKLQRLEERVEADTGVLASISTTLAENTATRTEPAQESGSETDSWIGKMMGAASDPTRGSLVLSDDGVAHVVQAKPQPMADMVMVMSQSLERNLLGERGEDRNKASEVPKIQLHRHGVDSEESSNASNGHGRRFSDVAKSIRDAAEESALPLGSSKSQNSDAGHTSSGTPDLTLARWEPEAADSGSQSVTTPRSVPWADSKVPGSQSVKPPGSSPWGLWRTGATGVSGSARVPYGAPKGLGNDSASKLAAKPVDQWDETDVASWVASLSAIPDGIAEVVHAHAITGPVLLSLSSEDLAGLNIKKFGHRRLLVLAANELRKAVEGIPLHRGSASLASSNGNLPVQSSSTPNIHMQANSMTQPPTKSSQSVQTTKPAPKTTKSPSRYDRPPQLVQATSLSMNRTRSAQVLPSNSLGGLGSACVNGADRARIQAKRFQGAGVYRENSGQRSPAMPGSSSPSAPRRTADAKQGLSTTGSPRHPRGTAPQPLGRVVQVPSMSTVPHSPGRSASPFLGGPGKSTTTVSTLPLRREVSSPVRLQCVGPTTSVVQRLTSRPGILT